MQRAWARASIFTATLMLSFGAQADLPAPDADQLGWLGAQIFRNECNGRTACLTAWNEGEDFPSLGIGHFIWYRAGQQAPFAETFPALLAFMQARGAALPAWLEAANFEQPWPDRAAFLAANMDPRQQELRDFLAAHMDLQTAFILERFEAAQDAVLAATPAQQRAVLATRFEAVANAELPYGLYALIDYVHFKGEGTAASERYQERGWGLLQVLQGMDDASAPLPAFVASAKAVLSARVALAPPERREERWLAGWHKRLDTYLPPATSR